MCERLIRISLDSIFAISLLLLLIILWSFFQDKAFEEAKATSDKLATVAAAEGVTIIRAWWSIKDSSTT